MKRLAILFLALGACGGGHLNGDYGKRVRAAVNAQADGKAEGDVRVDAEDAKQTLRAQRETGGKAADSGGSGGAIVLPSMGGGGGGYTSSSSGAGADNPIRLEGVR